ncbi:MAG: hypothetical protein JSS02_18385 [Planctomycetes bacterium]|nr:hypothetical protein [Planctomycetota bacterium]
MPWNWLKHAFAIEPDRPVDPTAGQRAVIDRLCRQVVARGLTTPALLFLESSSPLHYVSSQTLQFFMPVLSVVADRQACADFAGFLEQRGSVEFLCRRLTELQHESNPPAPQPPPDSPSQIETAPMTGPEAAPPVGPANSTD